jgi:hypothetical protein
VLLQRKIWSQKLTLQRQQPLLLLPILHLLLSQGPTVLEAAPPPASNAHRGLHPPNSQGTAAPALCPQHTTVANLGEDGAGGRASTCSARLQLAPCSGRRPRRERRWRARLRLLRPPVDAPPSRSALLPSVCAACSRRRQPPLARVWWESKGRLNGRTESSRGRVSGIDPPGTARKLPVRKKSLIPIKIPL